MFEHKKLLRIKKKFKNLKEDVNLERVVTIGDIYFTIENTRKQILNLKNFESDKIGLFELWYLIAVNVVKDIWQEEIIKKHIRKYVIDFFCKNVYCPEDNVIEIDYCESKSKTEIDIHNEKTANIASQRIIDMIKKNKGNRKICFSIAWKKKTSGHWLSFVYDLAKNEITSLDPAKANFEIRDWGHHEWLNIFLKKMVEKGKYTIKEYTPEKPCQALEVDIFCQSWSLFLQVKEINGELENQTFSPTKALFPFLFRVFKSLQKNKSCCQQLRRNLCDPDDDVNTKIDLKTVREGKFRGDAEFCYFTYKSKLNISDFFSFMDMDDIAKTSYWKIPLLGIYIDLDDEEMDETKHILQILNAKDNVFKRFKLIRKKLNEIEDIAKKRKRIMEERNKPKKKRRILIRGGCRKFNKKKVFVAKNGRRYIKNALGQTRFISDAKK
tara:strand:- start:252 stop:1568 length:1317 start_codon:yes stop_codon:yes gene_type:complete